MIRSTVIYLTVMAAIGYLMYTTWGSIFMALICAAWILIGVTNYYELILGIDGFFKRMTNQKKDRNIDG